MNEDPAERLELIDVNSLIYYLYKNASNEKHTQMISHAVAGHINIVKSLVSDKGVDPSYKDNLALSSSCHKGHIEVARFLLSDKRVRDKLVKERDSGHDQGGCILGAVIRNRIEIVKMLLEDGTINPAFSDNRCLRTACMKGHTEIVEMLLQDNRVDPCVPENMAIQIAVKNGHEKIVKMLLADKRVDPSENDNTALRMAAGARNREIFNMLLADERVQVKAVERLLNDIIK